MTAAIAATINNPPIIVEAFNLVWTLVAPDEEAVYARDFLTDELQTFVNNQAKQQVNLAVVKSKLNWLDPYVQDILPLVLNVKPVDPANVPANFDNSDNFIFNILSNPTGWLGFVSEWRKRRDFGEINKLHAAARKLGGWYPEQPVATTPNSDQSTNTDTDANAAIDATDETSNTEAVDAAKQVLDEALSFVSEPENKPHPNTEALTDAAATVFDAQEEGQKKIEG